MRVLILAAGKQSRWRETGGSGYKQFIEVDGESIIHRTFRLVTERIGARDAIYTVVRDPEDAMWEGLNPRKAEHENWMGEMGKFLDHQHLWGNHAIVVLWGDVYYTERTLDTILGHKPTQPTIYGRAQSGERRSESFGMRWGPKDRAEVIRIAKECAEVGLNQKGGPWRWFLRRHTGSDNYDVRDVRRVAKEHNGWVEVGHDETDDFDEYPQVRKWRRRWGHATESNGGSMSEMIKIKLLRSRAGVDHTYKAGGEYLFPAAEAAALIKAGKAVAVAETPVKRAEVRKATPARKQRKPPTKVRGAA